MHSEPQQPDTETPNRKTTQIQKHQKIQWLFNRRLDYGNDTDIAAFIVAGLLCGFIWKP